MKKKNYYQLVTSVESREISEIHEQKCCVNYVAIQTETITNFADHCIQIVQTIREIINYNRH